MLQSLGQPAIAEVNVIVLGDHRLEVAQACSGLRLFIGISALAFAYVLFGRRRWWENVFIVLSIVPIALLTNALRITTTGLLYQFVSGEAARTFSHDIAGFVMIIEASVFFLLAISYMKRLFPESEQMQLSELVGHVAK